MCNFEIEKNKMNLIENHNKDILNLCKRHKVKSLYAFGSVLTNQFNKDSDVDLIVDFEPLDVLDYGDNYYSLKFSLENILKRTVDLLEEKAIKISSWIGSIQSLLLHTFIFVISFALVLFGVAFERVLLTLTTILSLEAIYLSIFIQMSMVWKLAA